MMIKTYALFLFSIHILGDFYFQSERQAQQKKQSYTKVLQHCLFYGFAAVPFCLLSLGSKRIIASVLLVSSHFLIDSCKYLLKKEVKESKVFIVDQLFHLLSVLIISYFFHESSVCVHPSVLAFLSVFTDSPLLLLSWMGMALLIGKPVNVLIKQTLSSYRPQALNQEERGGAGALIGTLERLLMLIFLNLGQYGAIAWVLTAKSIARYSKIAEEKDFAEYYLSGTLLSMVLVLVIFLLSRI